MARGAPRARSQSLFPDRSTTRTPRRTLGLPRIVATIMGSWLPLESNPDVLNPFVHRLGLPADWGFCDMFGLDPDLLAMVPQPCAAVCLLFPSEKISKPRREEFAAKAAGQPPVPGDLFFCQQVDGIGNACGTIACMHAVANAAASGNFALDPECTLAKFIEATKATPAPPDRGQALLEAKELQEMSDATAAAGETEGAGTDDAQNQHFIAFVNFNGMVYELDGCNTHVPGRHSNPRCCSSDPLLSF